MKALKSILIGSHRYLAGDELPELSERDKQKLINSGVASDAQVAPKETKPAKPKKTKSSK